MRKAFGLILALGISCMLIASEDQEKFSLTSPGFKNGETIPKVYVCSRLGDNKSPELNWTHAPANTKNFVVVCDDIDAEQGFFIHWIVYHIPANTNHLKEGIAKIKKLPHGAMQGMNNFHRLGYDGPCLSPGSYHRYVFTVYALDTPLDLGSSTNYSSLQEAMKGHIIGKAELMGYFRN